MTRTSDTGYRRAWRSRLARAALVLVAVAALLGALPVGGGVIAPRPALAAQDDELLKELQDLQRQLEESQRRQQELQRRLSQKRGQQRSAQRELAAIQRKLSDTQTQLRRVERDLRATQSKVSQVRAELANLEAQLSERKAALLSRIRLLAERGRLGYLEVLLTANSFSDFVARFDLIRRLIAADVRLFGEVQATRQTVAERKQVLENYALRVASLKQQTIERKREIESAQRQQAQLVASLDREADRIYDDLEATEEEEAAVQAKIREIQQRLKNDFGQLTWAWPLRSYRITSYFGPRINPITKQNRNHNGLDLAAPTGTPVYAAAKGVVIISRYSSSYGNLIVIDHGNGWATLYAHNQKRLVSVGDRVEKGDKIALVGSTGRSTGPHVHFEIQRDGEPVNPLDYLP